MGENQVKLHGIRYSPFSARVEIALKMKGVEYEFIDEDIQNKSEELLRYNPIHKKIPVLVHAGRPVAESLVIIEYIDETWKGAGIADLLPSHPYERADARFWAKFIDDKLMLLDAILGEGEAGEKATEEARELLKFLENEIKGKKFFGGNGMGFLDIVGSRVAYWGPIFQEIAGKEVFTRENYPAIWAWIDRLLACNVVKETVPSREDMVTFFRPRLSAMRARVNPPK